MSKSLITPPKLGRCFRNTASRKGRAWESGLKAERSQLLSQPKWPVEDLASMSMTIAHGTNQPTKTIAPPTLVARALHRGATMRMIPAETILINLHTSTLSRAVSGAQMSALPSVAAQALHKNKVMKTPHRGQLHLERQRMNRSTPTSQPQRDRIFKRDHRHLTLPQTQPGLRFLTVLAEHRIPAPLGRHDV